MFVFVGVEEGVTLGVLGIGVGEGVGVGVGLGVGEGVGLGVGFGIGFGLGVGKGVGFGKLGKEGNVGKGMKLLGLLGLLLKPKNLSINSSAYFLNFLISFLISKSKLGTFLGADKVRYNDANYSTESEVNWFSPKVNVN